MSDPADDRVGTNLELKARVRDSAVLRERLGIGIDDFVNGSYGEMIDAG